MTSNCSRCGGAALTWRVAHCSTFGFEYQSDLKAADRWISGELLLTLKASLMPCYAAPVVIKCAITIPFHWPDLWKAFIHAFSQPLLSSLCLGLQRFPFPSWLILSAMRLVLFMVFREPGVQILCQLFHFATFHDALHLPGLTVYHCKAPKNNVMVMWLLKNLLFRKKELY